MTSIRARLLIALIILVALIVRYLDAIDVHRWLARGGGENNPRPPATGRYLHDASQVLVGAIHKQSVQIDLGRFGAELAALQDETLYVQVSYRRKIFIRIGKCADNARWHPRLPDLLSETYPRITLARPALSPASHDPPHRPARDAPVGRSQSREAGSGTLLMIWYQGFARRPVHRKSDG